MQHIVNRFAGSESIRTRERFSHTRQYLPDFVQFRVFRTVFVNLDTQLRLGLCAKHYCEMIEIYIPF